MKPSDLVGDHPLDVIGLKYRTIFDTELSIVRLVYFE
jgi:hypothetical protein